MNCKCCRAWFSSSDASQELCAGCRRVLARVSPIIEPLSAELEQVKRERDAAVEDLKLWHCFSCNNKSTPYCQECSRNRVRLIKGYMSGRDHYEWRGVKEEPHD